MSKGKKKPEQPDSPPSFPRNTVTLSLDGTENNVLKNYEACQTYLRYWNFCRGRFRVRVGNRVFYTTPTSGSFYYVVRCRGRSIVFVIDARHFWLTGWFTEHGFYQMIYEGNGLYMDVSGLINTGFSANHTVISEGGVDRTRLGLHELLDAFDAIWAYRGPKDGEPVGFREAIGRFAVVLMETKYKEIYRRSRAALRGDFSYSRFGNDGVDDLVHNWQARSREVMKSFDPEFDNIEKISDINKKIDEMFLLYVDAWFEGHFRHDELLPPPRNEVWDAIDDGKGDGHTPHPVLPDAVPPPKQPRGRGKAGTTTLKGGRKRGNSGDGQQTTKRTKATPTGLRGGGLGGSSLVPPWFSNWSQDDHMAECNELVKKAKAELKLEFLELQFKPKESKGELPIMANMLYALATSYNDGATTPPSTTPPPSSSRAPPPSSSTAPSSSRAPPPSFSMAPPPSSSTAPPPFLSTASSSLSSASALELSHIKDLQGSAFLADDVVERFLHRLSTTFHGGDDGIAFIAPSIAHGLATSTEDPSTFGVDLSSQLTIFPVNDNQNLNGEGGSHWSLLVLDARRQPPRFIYHDSILNGETGNGFNFPAACRLADRLRLLLPAAQEGVHEWSTPLQTTGHDCAVYLMAVASAISNWWRGSTDSERLEEDWSRVVWEEVNANSVALMRSEMAELFLNNIDIKEMTFFRGPGQ